MAKILINGVNSKSGGGLSILTNYLKLLLEDSNFSKHNYVVLAATDVDLSIFCNDYIFVENVSGFISSPYFAPFIYEYYLPKYIVNNQFDIVFNMGDLIINTTCPQLYLFDWSYAVYPDHSIWKYMDIKSKLNRLVKLSFLKKRISFKGLVMAQTEVTASKLMSIYGIKNVVVVPNAVSIDNYEHIITKDFMLPQKTNLLYLTHYYPHKNLEIFLPLAKKIKDNNLDFRIVITIDKTQHVKARQILEKIKLLKLDDIIINVGAVHMRDVPSLYKQCDGLLMPTLLESFSGTYVEAMHHEIPIFTSNLDFAEAVCGEAAFYFEPENADSIKNCLITAFENKHLLNDKVRKGRERLAGFPNWFQTFNLFQAYLSKTIEENYSGK